MDFGNYDIFRGTGLIVHVTKEGRAIVGTVGHNFIKKGVKPEKIYFIPYSTVEFR